MKKTIDVKVKFVLSYQEAPTGTTRAYFDNGEMIIKRKSIIEEYDDLKLFKAAALTTAKSLYYTNIKGYRVSDTWEISKKDTLVMK